MKILSAFKRLVILVSICLPFSLQGQTASKTKPNWQNLDLKTDSVFGISTEKAYNELLKDKKHTTVLIAVIDGGVDINHEDLKSVIWNNPGETAANNIDDDKNGYADDIHGWDFIGSARGDVQYDNMELVRLINLDRSRFVNVDSAKLKGKDLEDFKEYRRMRNDVAGQTEKATRIYNNIAGFNEVLTGMLPGLNNGNPSLNDIKHYRPQSDAEGRVKEVLIESFDQYGSLAEFRKQEIEEGLKHYKEKLQYHLNFNYDPRAIVGDNYSDSNEHFYGNNDVTGPDAEHGSHVSGIIGAVRDNNVGVKGVANDVMIMSVRTIPNGDERDKDVANAIRYATANGAKVINMSFGKGYSHDKKVVDEAVKFAMSKDVLIIHSAGNDNKNTDTEPDFPNKYYQDNSGSAQAWIQVGASGLQDDETLKASFSNYGKTSVDVFAPGVKINSATPNSTYTEHDGTSMAAPMVTGLAALIRSYYPKLTAMQVKEIILKSVVKIDHKIVIKNGDGKRRVQFSEVCSSGGIVNAYNALKLAATY